MRQEPTTIEDWIPVYEGLVFSTARLVIEHGVEIDFEDACAILREKVWKALRSFDAKRLPRKTAAHIGGGQCRCARCSYVFMCVRDKRKDLEELKRRYDAHIEDFAHHYGGNGQVGSSDPLSYFEAKNGLVAEDVYRAVEDEPVLIPSTLTDLELRVVCLLYERYTQTEITLRLGVSRRDVEQSVKAIREKMSDWKPAAAEDAELVSLDALREAA